MASGSRDDDDYEWESDAESSRLPAGLREIFPALEDGFHVRDLSGGLLHRSFHVRAGDSDYVLQRVSDVFAPEIHDNIESVSQHLKRRGFETSTLLPARDGATSALIGSQGRWRLMPHLGGASFRRLQSVEQAVSAGRLVGRFHAAMRDFDEPLAPMGIPYRDTPHYLRALREALDTKGDHRLSAEVSPLGQRIFEAFAELGEPLGVENRVIHGDLKLDNLLFESVEPPGRDRAFALIDLDTLMRAPLWVELGDAWRSWCNAAGEDTRDARFEMSFFEASTRGFFEGYAMPLPSAELDSLATATERVSLELCARYVTDALEENYFNWDESSFPARGEHNVVRAFGQWAFYEAIRACRREREEILRAGR
jgi:Ser/Thr protein kinase RdoA (MazF antagonist)